MKDDNSKVPVAISSCFMIAFILQGALKLCGVLVFEKALDWEIFTIIDCHKWLQIVYYSLMTIIAIYCLSFTLTSKPYSKKWWHYVLIGVVATINTVLKFKFIFTTQQHILFDIAMYIIVPLIVNFTTNENDRLQFNVFNVVLTISIQIALYFCYLGLNYWSALLNTLLPINPILISASAYFLIQFEVYTGLITLMLSVNVLISKIRRNDMFIPTNIASKKAKLEAKKEKLEKQLAVINAEIAELDKKENAK